MPHPPFSRSARRGFTIIEIAIIIIIIALMLIIVLPHFLNQINGGRAKREKADLDALNVAIEHYALDNGKMEGHPSYEDLRRYLDPKTDVAHNDGKDVFGNSYGPFTIGSPPSVPPGTAAKLSGVAGPDFWSPHQ